MGDDSSLVSVISSILLRRHCIYLETMYNLNTIKFNKMFDLILNHILIIQMLYTEPNQGIHRTAIWYNLNGSLGLDKILEHHFT